MDNCACIKGLFDIHVGHRGCKKMVYQDMSTWMLGSGYEVPESYTVNVLMPGRSEEYPVEVKTGINNIITTVELLGHDEPICLEDGIYCFTVNSCGVKYQTSRAYLCTLECKLEQLVAKAKDEIDFQNVLDIRGYIDAIRVNAELNKVEKAKDFFKIADRKLKHLTCSC